MGTWAIAHTANTTAFGSAMGSGGNACRRAPEFERAWLTIVRKPPVRMTGFAMPLSASSLTSGSHTILWRHFSMCCGSKRAYIVHRLGFLRTFHQMVRRVRFVISSDAPIVGGAISSLVSFLKGSKYRLQQRVCSHRITSGKTFTAWRLLSRFFARGPRRCHTFRDTQTIAQLAVVASWR